MPKSSYLNEETVEKAKNFLGEENIFCVMRGIVKKPEVDHTGEGEVYYTFNLKTRSKDGFSQTYHCIVPSNKAREFTEKEVLQQWKDKEVIVIPALQNSTQEWKATEKNKKNVSNRLTVYVTRLAIIGEGDSNRVYDDTLAVNW